jgi:hypothetical protein
LENGYLAIVVYLKTHISNRKCSIFVVTIAASVKFGRVIVSKNFIQISNKIYFLSKYANGKDGVLYLTLFYNRVNTLYVKWDTARVPSALNILIEKQAVHKLYGGGISVFTLGNSFQDSIQEHSRLVS